MVVRGRHSEWAVVTNGIPQGPVLGPLLFLVYINDFPEVVISSIKIFAYDTELYYSVSTLVQLQNDINAITKWSEQWQLAFNEKKCTSLHTGPRNPEHSYKMKDVMPTSTSAERGLGINVDTD